MRKAILIGYAVLVSLLLLVFTPAVRTDHWGNLVGETVKTAHSFVFSGDIIKNQYSSTEIYAIDIRSLYLILGATTVIFGALYTAFPGRKK